MRYRVLITSSQFSFHQAQMFRGIIEYVRGRSRWAIDLAPETEFRFVAESLHRYDGVIANAEDPRLLRSLDGARIPVVNVLTSVGRPEISEVTPDEVRIGALGAEHLLARWYRALAFCGCDVAWSAKREQGFADACRASGVPCATFRWRGGGLDWMSGFDRHAFRRWLLSLAKPLGVMACNDTIAGWVIEEATDAGLRVPSDVAALGVDNEEMRCELGPMPLSSVDVDLVRIGYESARVLDERLANHALPSVRVAVPPRRVVARQSTQWAATGHTGVDDAVRLIHESHGMALSVDQVVEIIGVPRRTLERLFRDRLSTSIGAEIQRVRMEHVRRLVQDSTAPLAAIAERCGFGGLSHMTHSYRRHFGHPPAIDRELGDERLSARGTLVKQTR